MTAENPPTRKQRTCSGILAFIDSTISIFFFAPLVVGYWRGCWQLMDAYLFPNKREISIWASFTIGVIPGLFFCLFQDPIQRLFDYKTRPIWNFLFSRLYTTLYCVISVNHWRGVWIAWDFYTGVGWVSGATSCAIGIFTLAITRGLINILAPPFLIVPDHPKNYFAVQTQFNSKKENCGRFLLDSFFTVVVTGSLVVFVWRGTWIFLDNKLFPGQPKYSAWGSLVIGGTITLLVFIAQLVMIPCLANMKKSIGKLILEDCYHTLCFIGDINIWRGVWNLLNIYLYPGKPILSNWITVVTGLVILMIFYNSNTILVRGAKMDGTFAGNQNIIFPTYYLRFFFKKKLQPKKTLQDFWVNEDEEPIQALPTSAIKEVPQKTIICDGRGLGDGHSVSENYNDYNDSLIASKPNTTFASEVVPVTINPIQTDDLSTSQSETIL